MSGSTLRGIGGRPPFAYEATKKCANEDPEIFFPAQHTAVQDAAAKRLCRECPFQVECLEWAVETQQDSGIFGATNPRERAAIREHRKTQDTQQVSRPAVSPPRTVLDPQIRQDAFVVARRYLDKELNLEAAMQLIPRDRLYAAIAVIQHAPDLETMIVAGEMTLYGAQRYIRGARIARRAAA